MEKAETQKGCTRMAIFGRHIYCVIWELNLPFSDTAYASFSARAIQGEGVSRCPRSSVVHGLLSGFLAIF